MLVSLSAEKTALFLRQTERLFSVYKGLCWNTDKGGRAAYFQRVNHHDITMNNKETKVNVSIPHVQNGWVQNGWVQNGWVQNGWPDSRNGHILSTSYNSCKHLDVPSLGLHFFSSLRCTGHALSTKRCMLGNQDRSLARVVLFLLCSPILSPLEAVSRAIYDDFTQVYEVRNFSRMHSTLFATFS